MQFKAGYIVDSIASVISDFKFNLNIDDKRDKEILCKVDGLLKYVSSFDIDFPYRHNLDFRKLHPVLATLNNIVTRGLPTKAPFILENIFCGIGLIKQKESEFELKFSKILGDEIKFTTIFELLHIIEPGLEINKSN